MNVSKEAKVGTLAVIALVILYLGVNFLKGSDIFSRSNIYFVEYTNVDGLTTSNPVLLNGLSVGRVKAITLQPEKGNSLQVSLDIQRAIQIPEGTKAILADGGVLGGKVVRLLMGPNPTVILPSGSYLVPETELGFMSMLQAKANPVLSHADTLMMNLAIASAGFKETGETLNKVLNNFDESSVTLKGILTENRVKFTTLMTNMNTLSASLVETEKGIKPILSNANTLLDSLNAIQLGSTINQANQTLAELQGLLNGLKSGDGTAGKLLTDEKLYNNLNYTMISLNQLLANFREHPKRYINVSVFGGRKNDKGSAEAVIDTVLKFKEPDK